MADLTSVTDIKLWVSQHKRELNFKNIAKRYQDIGTQYAYDVLCSDKYVTGRDTQLACFRHLRDLNRQETSDFSYKYDEKYVSAIEYFAREIPDPTNLSQMITPMPWESFILDSLMGWREIETGGCRYHIAHISVGRKQGKTWIAAIMMNFYFFMIGLNRSAQDFLIASVDNEHAQKLFDYVALQARQIKELDDFKEISKKQDVDVQRTQIVAHNNANTIRRGSAQGGGFDSKHDLLVVFDEMGGIEPKYNEKINQAKTGQGDEPQRMMIEISTAYPQPKVMFKHEEDQLRNTVEQDDLRDSEDTFFIVFAQDSENEVFEPETWEKSNPLLANKETYDKKIIGLTDLRNNMERTGELASFVNKTLNLWSRQFADSYLSYDVIKQNVISSYDVRGKDVFVGIDGSMTNDNTAYGLIYPDGDGRFFIQQHSFIPFAQAKTIEAKEKQDGLNYRELEKQGYCTITNNSTGTINKDQVWSWLIEYLDKNKLNLQAIVVDPAYMKWYASRVENLQPDWPYIQIRQTSFELNDPTKSLQQVFIDKKVSISNDPILIDGLNNSVIKQDKGGMIKIDRTDRTSDHIDSTDAIINAFSQAENYYNDFNDVSQNYFDTLKTQKDKANYFMSMFGGKDE
ncbi:terminase TerL endonuclease subunit [Lactobacillus sp. ESL0677]|uniref:terminase TerL endonuclease subunit n=1 Tax=Lactobacillus sp. ESL0677 TaxID=2983208 RepID=UPI0023F8F3C9|nr:terminase TerL endonuclease subunit [Lactobacillus sp. ESL0677]WEV36224.1 terminase large subunit [Lactobacillus sp. ESL0677]